MPRAKSEPTDSAVTSTEAAQQTAASESPETIAVRGINADNYMGNRPAVFDPEPANVVELSEIKVMITRDPACKIPKTVYRHELPALRYIHKQENVTVLEEYPVKVAGFDIETEFLRLSRKYDRKNFIVAATVYGLEGEKLPALTGVERSGRAGTDLPASMNKTRAPSGPVVRKHAA